MVTICSAHAPIDPFAPRVFGGFGPLCRPALVGGQN